MGEEATSSRWGKGWQIPQAASRRKESPFWGLGRGGQRRENVTLEAEPQATPSSLVEHLAALWMHLRTVTAGNR